MDQLNITNILVSKHKRKPKITNVRQINTNKII
jgi:hypothetical protein